jgi:AraC family transcriptional regulator of adaptative response/methylated-DNA-[protein]-cysteine methyltransferase
MNAMTEPEGYHFHVMRRAIDQIDRADARLSLEDLAARLDMSPAHFQRTFSRWVGVSPQRYQQYLTLDHARSLLAARFTTLGTAFETGLSGAGRLHDLFVKWEAMTPGDYARGGEGLTIRWGWFHGPFGRTLAMGTERGLCGMAFSEETGDDAAMADLRGRWPDATYLEDAAALAPWVQAAFGQSGEARLFLIGAPFQIKVWEALLRVPEGALVSYDKLADSIGKPSAARAVGTAVGANPISFLIPCHRVIRKSGTISHYHWGRPRKLAMIGWEAAQRERLVVDAAE